MKEKYTLSIVCDAVYHIEDFPSCPGTITECPEVRQLLMEGEPLNVVANQLADKINDEYIVPPCKITGCERWISSGMSWPPKGECLTMEDLEQRC